MVAITRCLMERRPRSTPALTAPRLLLVAGRGNGDCCSLVFGCAQCERWITMVSVGNVAATGLLFPNHSISPTQTFMAGPFYNTTRVILDTTRFATIASAWARSLHYFAPDSLVSLYCQGIAAAHGGGILSSLFLGLFCVLPPARHDW